MDDLDRGPIAGFFGAKFILQLKATDADPEMPSEMDWARADMAVDETLRQLLVIGATQKRLAWFIAGEEIGDPGRRKVRKALAGWLEIADAQVEGGPITPLWRRFVNSDDVSASLLYPDPGTQIVDSSEAFNAGLSWAMDGGRTAMAWGLAHPARARAAFDLSRRQKARIERLSSREVDFDFEAIAAQTLMDYIDEEYGGLP